MDNQLINISKAELDKKIYRVFNKERFFQLFDDNELVLVRPKEWKDPFENFLMNCQYEGNDGTKFTIGFRENYYGQCWTEKVESDGIWRIYAPNEDGFKVQTTIRKLLSALINNVDEFPEQSCFIGRVKYLKRDAIKEIMNSPTDIKDMILDTTGKGQASTLLFKKFPFNHEKEIRLIHAMNEKVSSDLFKIPINPMDLFDGITIDPRMKYSDFRSMKDKIRKYGYSKKVIQSNLYRVKVENIRIDI